MRLYNTFSRRKEPLTFNHQPVTMYVCGITPYDTTHLGHARTYVLFDVLHRYLRHRGNEVRYVQNITDVDEPLFRKAAQLGIPYQKLAADSEATYFSDMKALDVLPPTLYPKASEEIAAMQDVIASLLKDDHAYLRDGSALFRVNSHPRYGRLSGMTPWEMLARNAEQDESAPPVAKENPLDFLLWRPAGPGEDSWPSPWGAGRPGWHIECSAMALKYLGPSIDIHGGGADLIFPHHENEIAQSESCTGIHPFARHWVHVAMVRMDGIKMSKSLGNLVMVRKVLQRHSPAALRLYLLGHPYREPFDYDANQLQEAEQTAALLGSTASRREGRQKEVVRRGGSIAPQDGADVIDAEPLRSAFFAAMDDDLDTASAIEQMVSLASAIAGGQARDTAAAQTALREMMGLLGLSVS